MAAVAIELKLSDDVALEPDDGVGELLPEESEAVEGDCVVMAKLGMLGPGKSGWACLTLDVSRGVCLQWWRGLDEFVWMRKTRMWVRLSDTSGHEWHGRSNQSIEHFKVYQP